MRIMILAEDFKPNVGGVAEYTYQLAHNLKLLDNTICVITNKTKRSELFDQKATIEIVRNNFSNRNRFTKSFLLNRTFFHKAKEVNPDVIILNSLGTLSLSYAINCYILAKAKRIPYIVMTHGTEISKDTSFTNRTIKKILLRGAKAIIANSTFTRKIVEEKYGIKKRKFIVLNPGISSDWLKDYTKQKIVDYSLEELTKGRKVILSIGRLIERKGFDKAIEAINKVKEEIPNLIYIIGGRGEYENKLNEMVRKKKLENYVHLVGYLTDKQKAALYNKADLFIMPNYMLDNGDYEGFGIVFLEAASYGIPCIAGNIGGSVDAVKHMETGIIVNSNNINEISGAIMKLLKNERLSKMLGAKGKCRVISNYRWELLVEKFYEELKKLVKCDE